MSLDARQLANAVEFATVSYAESTTSTNTDLLADVDAGPWTVRITTNQTAGKGRLGRVWEAPAGANIAMSVLLMPSSMDRVGTIPLAAGLAVADAISGTRVKWPNDVLLGEKKLCGILAEAGALQENDEFKSGQFKSGRFKSGEFKSGLKSGFKSGSDSGFTSGKASGELPPAARVVVGWGINVELGEDQLPVPHATSLRIAGKSTDHTQIATDVLHNFYNRMQQWQADDPQLMDDYRNACASIGCRVRLESHSETVEGVVDTVTDDGRISIDGTAFSAGDVSHLRLKDGKYS